ncbi:MAG: hypothetical protein B7Y78_12855 [Caulobacter sp. 35-67-4]|nr:MAG: hypothetical protein B7Y81_11055 [Caulobacter sp. 32-67-35]OYX91085.1 MAG: hypothetical protein B7Y78_12855 [Caulobacter sp. 35-67-4]HQR91563.1 hypothetical protein [Caulobacter sp.]
MRILVLIAALVCVAPAAHAEEARENRYGPRPSRPTTSLNANTGYAGPILGWAGKQDAIVSRAPAPQAVNEPWRQPYVAPQARQPMAAAQAQAPMSEPWRNLGARPQAGTPAPQALPPMSEPWRNLGARPQASAPAQAAPATMAAYSPPPQAVTPSMARTYSVGRQYGLQPDALPPLQPNGMVFIAPSEEAPRLKDDEPRHGSAEWLAAGARGDEDEDRDNARDGDR